MLAGGAAAEVAACGDDIARLCFPEEVGVDILHAVGRQLLRVGGVQVTGGDDDVGIDIIAIAEGIAVKLHRVAPFCGKREKGRVMPLAGCGAAPHRTHRSKPEQMRSERTAAQRL